MKQLTLKDIFILINQLKKAGYTTEEIAAMPIYIGDDDGLNGIHTAWGVGIFDPECEDDADIMYLINESYGRNVEVKGKSILIS